MPVAASCLALVEFITCIDNAVVAAGNRMGISDRARSANRLRFFLHAVFISALIPVYAGIAQLAGVGGFDSALFKSVVTLLVIAVGLLGYLTGYRSIAPLMPVNYFGCLRYAQSVTPAGYHPGYEYSAAELAQKARPPLASIVTVLIGLVLSVWTGVVAGFWLPAAVTALMLVAGVLPSGAKGALATSSLEILFSAGLVYSLLSLA